MTLDKGLASCNLLMFLSKDGMNQVFSYDRRHIAEIQLSFTIACLAASAHKRLQALNQKL